MAHVPPPGGWGTTFGSDTATPAGTSTTTTQGHSTGSSDGTAPSAPPASAAAGTAPQHAPAKSVEDIPIEWHGDSQGALPGHGMTYANGAPRASVDDIPIEFYGDSGALSNVPGKSPSAGKSPMWDKPPLAPNSPYGVHPTGQVPRSTSLHSPGIPDGAPRTPSQLDAIAAAAAVVAVERDEAAEACMEVGGEAPSEMESLVKEAAAFEGAAVVSMIQRGDDEGPEGAQKAIEITMEDGVTLTLELDSGEKRLLDLGYKQELKRVLNLFQLYCFAVSTITVYAGVVPMYGQGYNNGGPVALVWYWWITVFFVHLVGLSFAEIASSLPLAGSLYFWAAALAGPRLAPVVSFFTGWLEFFGPMCGLSSVAFNGALTLQTLVFMITGNVLDKDEVFGLACGTVIVSAAINMLPVFHLANVICFSTVFQLTTALVLIVMLPLVAPTHQPASFVFGKFNCPLDVTMVPSQAYAFILALMVSQFSLYGYDGVCHLAEETKRSDKTAPVAIVGSISTMSLVGWLLILSATFSIKDTADLMPAPDANGNAFLQIVWDAFYERFGTGLGAQVYTGFIWTSFFFGCVVGMTAATRVLFSLARDGGFPLSHVWRQLNPHNKVPVYAVLLIMALGVLFLLPLLGSFAIFAGITSAQSIAWVGAYSVPIFFRLIQKEEDFCPGPFYMGDYIGVLGGKIVHLAALLWVLYTVVAFNLPYVFPVTEQNFNWAPVALVICLSVLTAWWLLDARHWFVGPLGLRAASHVDEELPPKEALDAAAQEVEVY